MNRSALRSVNQNVLRLKAMLPTASYVHLLHQGVMTGFLPRFLADGKPSGQFDNLSPRDRVDLARYLIDKVVPDAPKELALVAPTPDTLDALTITHLPSDELRRIASASLDDGADEPDLAVPAESSAAEPATAESDTPGPARAGAA
jgi:hypothetical protein